MARSKFNLYYIDTFGEPLEGSTDPLRCTVHGVAKEHHGWATHVGSEFICNRLAIAIGLPTPPGVVAVDEEGGKLFVSVAFGPGTEKPPAADVAGLCEQHPDLACGIAIFDCWVGNRDRHTENLAFAEGLIDPIIFDHSEAFMGPLNNPEELLSAKNLELPIFEGSVVKRLIDPDPFHHWYERIESVHDGVIDAFVEEAQEVGVITDEFSEACRVYLKRRKNCLGKMVQESREQFDSVPADAWSLV